MRLMRRLRMFGRWTFHRQAAEADLSDELQDYVEQQTERYRSTGLSPEQARLAALREAGGIEQVKEQCREARGTARLESALKDLRFSVRLLRKSPGFTAVLIATLALGIGANTAIFSVVKAVLLASLPYQDPNRIVAVWTVNPQWGEGPSASTPGDFALWKERNGVFEDLTPSYDNEQTLTGQGAPQLLIGYAVSARYLRILGTQPQLGRLYTEAEDKPGGEKVALLSDMIWRARFHADPHIIGRSIALDGAPYTVLGVMPRAFDYPSNVEVWTPAAMDAAWSNDFTHKFVRILGRLKPGVSLAAAQRSLNRVEAQVTAAHPATDSGNHVLLTPLREQLAGDIRTPLLMLQCAAALVLLIACANTAGLMLARHAERQREIALRLALGCSRWRLIQQFGTESLLPAALGGSLGILLAAEGRQLLLALFPNDVANLSIPKLTGIPMDGGVFLFAAAAALLTAIVFAIVPVWLTTGKDTDGSLNQSTRGSGGNLKLSRSRNAFVIAEVALCLMLLTGAGLLVTSFRKAADAHLGFQPEHLLSLDLFLPPNRYRRGDDAKKRALVEAVLRKLRALPQVESAAATNFLPLSGFWGTTNFTLRGQPAPKPGEAPQADNRTITPGYLHTMGIPLLRGRDFTNADRAASAPVAIISKSLAERYFHGRDPIDQQINEDSPEHPGWCQIVGVAGDVKAFGQDQPTHADLYRPFDQAPFPIVAFTLRTRTDPAALIKPAEQALWSVDSDLPVFKAIPMDRLASQRLAVRRASSALITGFAALALVLASIGIYGVMAYAVVQRTPEIGVRMALGARPESVLRMMLGAGLRMTAAGAAIGLAGALAVSRLLVSVLFEVSALNPVILVSALALLLAVALLAALLPALRAARIDPMQALRAE